MTDFRRGKVIPFAQEAAFFMKRGAREMDRNDLVAALAHYRRAYEQDPTDPDTSLAVAEILSQMQRFAESNRILLLQMSMGKPVPETFFGLACNYFGMHEFDYAAESLENYLDADPDGYFAADAEDFLDLLDDDEGMRAVTGLFTDEEYETDGVLLDARHMLDCAKPSEAIDLLEAHLLSYPKAVRAVNQLALAYFCNADRERALACAERALAIEPKNAQALCNRALFLRGRDDEAAEATLAQLLNDEPRTPDVLQSLSLLLLEFGRYDDADRVLQKLIQLLPYDENALHKAGYCRYMRGDTEGAARIYKKLMRIDPHDTVAKYYHGVCKSAEPRQKRFFARWSIQYQVPFSETFKRLNQVNRLLDADSETVSKLWSESTDFRNLLVWALSLPEARAKQSMLSLIYTFGDRRAEYVLRDFLLRTDQTDDMKRLVFGMLKRMGLSEPYMAHMGGKWIACRVSMLSLSGKVPAAYETVIQLLTEHMVGACSEEAVAEAMRVFRAYVDRLDGRFPRLSDAQTYAYAAALELIGCKSAGDELDEAALCRKYRITQTRLRHALDKLREQPEV